MKRLRKENINTPEYFDRQWGHQDPGYHDPVRQKALIRHVKDNDLVIDVGAGLYGSCQYISRYTKIKAQLMCIDFSEKAAKLVSAMCPEIHYITANIDPIPFGPDSFDCVIAGEIIEHMEDPRRFVKELVRICKPGGWITLSTVNTQCENAKKCEYAEHVWEFTPDDLLCFFLDLGKATYSLVGDYHFIECQKI
jgi:2-polyprenyl-3-methyl-5-hydroxy-6-metoxy-1,4-benzoquinol methylase